MSEILIEEGVEYEYEKTIFTLLPSFLFESKRCRAVTYKPDFMDPKGNSWLVEVKGVETPDFKIKWKMLKKHLIDTNSPLKIYLVKTLKGLREIIPELQSGQNQKVLRKRTSKQLTVVESSQPSTISENKRSTNRFSSTTVRVRP